MQTHQSLVRKSFQMMGAIAFVQLGDVQRNWLELKPFLLKSATSGTGLAQTIYYPCPLSVVWARQRVILFSPISHHWNRFRLVLTAGTLLEQSRRSTVEWCSTLEYHSALHRCFEEKNTLLIHGLKSLRQDLIALTKCKSKSWIVKELFFIVDLILSLNKVR